MPASMIRPETGSRWNVSGNSIAKVAMGPMQGSTPIRVPTMAPMKAKPRFAGVMATPNPTARLLSSSIRLPLRPDRDRQSQPDDEDRPGERDEHQGGEKRLDRAQGARRDSANADQQENGNHQPEPLKREPEDGEARGHEDHRAPTPRGSRLGLLLRAGLAQPLEQDDASQSQQKPAQQPGNVAGPHAQRGADRVVAGNPQAQNRDPQEHQSGEHMLVRQHLPAGMTRNALVVVGAHAQLAN